MPPKLDERDVSYDPLMRWEWEGGAAAAAREGDASSLAASRGPEVEGTRADDAREPAKRPSRRDGTDNDGAVVDDV